MQDKLRTELTTFGRLLNDTDRFLSCINIVKTVRPSLLYDIGGDFLNSVLNSSRSSECQISLLVLCTLL